MMSTSEKGSAIVKNLKLTLKTLSRAMVLTGTLLLSSFPAQPASITPANKKTIRDRVELIRERLNDRTANEQVAQDKLSYSVRALAQWGNWGNWGNWNNWLNWNNWNNWRNWGNWGNWGNF
jgi:hypothetical protein